MTKRAKILYAGAYERDYPRNQQFLRLLRQQGCAVTEVHEPYWELIRDKSSGFSGWLSVLLAAFRLVIVYSRLLVRVAGKLRGTDTMIVGYIGQFDMIVLGSLARLCRTPVLFNPLVTLTDTIVEDRALTSRDSMAARLIWLIDWAALRISSLIVTDTAENAAYLTDQFGISPNRIATLHVGADEELFSATPIGTGQAGLRVIFYGKMIPLHGIETILEAIRLLHEAGDSDITFEIIGSGQQSYLVDAFLAERPDAPVTRRSWVAYRRLPARINVSDVVLGIFGSGEKSARVVPNKVFQAMAIGAPIITRDSPAIRSVLTHGRSAVLVPPSDPEALAGAIRTLRNPETRRMIGNQARQTFERHGSDRTLGEQLIRILDRLIPSGSGSGTRHTGRTS